MFMVYTIFMGILDNLENSESIWDKEFKFEHQNLAVKIFTDICCESCTCKKEGNHAREK